MFTQSSFMEPSHDGIVTRHLFPHQADLLNMFERERHSLVVNTRQSGISTVLSLYAIGRAFANGDSVVITKPTERHAHQSLRRIRDLSELNCSDEISRSNRNSVQFESGGEVIVCRGSSNPVRGLPIDVLICDDFAFYDNQVEFFDNVYPVVHSRPESRPDCKMIICSVPNGVDKFYQLYMENNEFVSTRVSWDMIPGRDRGFRNNMINLIGDSAFRQQYEGSFV